MYAVLHITGRGNNRQEFVIIIKNTLTEIEVQTVTFIETKNNLADWVCDLGWKVRGIPKKSVSGRYSIL